MSNEANTPWVDATRVSIYDTVTIPPGSQTGPIRLSFGADSLHPTRETLFDLGERQLIEQILNNPVLLTRLLKMFGIQHPNCWIITEMLTEKASASWKENLPGDLDVVCGRAENGRPDFDFICCAQVKIRRVKTFKETGRFASGSGTEQSHYTAKLGFDHTLLLHCIVRVPQAENEGAASSWNSILNSDFEQAAKACYGTIRETFLTDRELYGYGWIGWGQAYGKNWDTCGGFSVDLVYPPPNRPAVDSADSWRTRREMIESFKKVVSSQQATGLPVIVQRKGR